MKLKNIIYTLLIAISLLSCEDKIVEFDMPDDSTKLAVFGFLSPGDTITSIYVGTLSPIVGKYLPQKIIDKALVKITHKQKEYVLNFDESCKAYNIKSNQLEIKAGETYSLQVSLDGYQTVNSTITVIEGENKSLEFDKFIKRTRNYEEQLVLAVKWKDNPDRKNYYALAMDVSSANIYDSDAFEQNPKMIMYDDENWNGKEKYSKDLYLQGYRDEAEIQIALINADEHYYMYHKKALEQDKYAENPFAEPIINYSNIENGVGVFCSYTKQIIRLKWKNDE
ncbi:MAG: hypothetical protein CSB01_01505 [Bacteroidia bacterium]|nr:MAG: hypothetical protein CSB01_01505 [Bacteroidia bacterium]